MRATAPHHHRGHRHARTAAPTAAPPPLTTRHVPIIVVRDRQQGIQQIGQIPPSPTARPREILWEFMLTIADLWPMMSACAVNGDRAGREEGMREDEDWIACYDIGFRDARDDRIFGRARLRNVLGRLWDAGIPSGRQDPKGYAAGYMEGARQ